MSWGHKAGKPIRWDFRLRTSHTSWKSSGGQNRRRAAGLSLMARASFSSCGLPRAEAKTIQSLLGEGPEAGPPTSGTLDRPARGPPQYARAGYPRGEEATDVLGENADLLGRDPREAMPAEKLPSRSTKRNAHRRGTRRSCGHPIHWEAMCSWLMSRLFLSSGRLLGSPILLELLRDSLPRSS